MMQYAVKSPIPYWCVAAPLRSISSGSEFARSLWMSSSVAILSLQPLETVVCAGKATPMVFCNLHPVAMAMGMIMVEYNLHIFQIC